MRSDAGSTRTDTCACQQGAGTTLQIPAAHQARATGRLIGADDNATDPAVIVQRLHGDHHLRCRTIGAGNDPLVPADGVTVHFGNYQRHLRIHTVIGAFVDHHASLGDCSRYEISRHFVGSAADGQVNSLEHFGLELLDRVRLAGEDNLRSSRAGGGDELDSPKRELSRFKQLPDDAPHGAGGATMATESNTANLPEMETRSPDR